MPLRLAATLATLLWAAAALGGEPVAPRRDCPIGVPPAAALAASTLGYTGAAARRLAHGLVREGLAPAAARNPDRIDLIYETAGSFVLVLQREGCLLGLLRSTRPALLALLRRQLGPAI
jgi:hypothetical protein